MDSAVADLRNYAFEGQLVRVVARDGDPWFVATDVATVLEIKNVRQNLADFDDDEKGVSNAYTLGGDQQVLVVSEPGLYRLIFQSRKPVAKKFQRWVVHEVLPSIRRTGKYAVAANDEPSPERLTEADLRAAPLLHKLHCIREIRAIRGRQVAAIMWNRLGLPALPPPPMTALGEARECLRHLLDADTDQPGVTIRAALEQALDDSAEHQALLIGVGLRALPESDAFVVCNDHPALRRIFEGSAWAGSQGHMRVLRRLHGADTARQSRFEGRQRRGTVLPSDYLDEDFKSVRA